MRLAIMTLILWPVAALAQEAAPVTGPQSCPAGAVWNGTACSAVETPASPVDDLPDRGGCHDRGSRQVVS